MYGRKRSPRVGHRVIASARVLVFAFLCSLASFQAVAADTQAALCSDHANTYNSYKAQRIAIESNLSVVKNHAYWSKDIVLGSKPSDLSSFDYVHTDYLRCYAVLDTDYPIECVPISNEDDDEDTQREYICTAWYDASPRYFTGPIADFDDADLPPLTDRDGPRDKGGNDYMGNGRGANCHDGARFTINEAFIPLGYVALPFDGFRRSGTSGWSCAAELIDNYLAQYPSRYAQDTARVTAIWWAYGPGDLQGYGEAGQDCTDLSNDCVELQYTAFDKSTERDFHDKISVYGRCPPSSEFSYTVGACLMPRPITEPETEEINLADLPREDLGLDDVNGCPAPVYVDLTVLGTKFKLLDFEPTCSVLQDYVRPILLMLATLTSAFVVMGMGLGGTGD